MCFKMLFKFVLFLLLILPFASAMKIITIQTDEEIYISTGSQLLIPCSFHANEPIQRNAITLEWSKTTEEGGMYTRLIYLTVTTTNVILREQHHDTRVQLFISRVHQGNCSLVIDNVNEEDSGIYELHLKIKGFTNNQIPKVRIIVRNQNEETGILPRDTENLRSLVNSDADENAQASLDQEGSTEAVTGTSQTVTEKEVQHEMATNGEILPSDTQNHNGGGLYFDMLLHSVVKSGQIVYVAIPMAIGLVVVILACIGGCYLGIRCYNGRIKPEDKYKAIQERRPVRGPSDPSGSEETTGRVSTDLSLIPPERTTVINMPSLSTASASCPSYTITMPLKEV